MTTQATKAQQAARVADYMAAHPASTLEEIEAACDAVRISKVISDMPRLGYGIVRGWRDVVCAAGDRTRHVQSYSLAFRPIHDQAARVADYMAAHPASTLKEIDRACDSGCISLAIHALRIKSGGASIAPLGQ